MNVRDERSKEERPLKIQIICLYKSNLEKKFS